MFAIQNLYIFIVKKSRVHRSKVRSGRIYYRILSTATAK
jgi:hypothetical protein